MSLVGTRPPTVDEWEKYELHHRSRMSTKPGITGMWQVSGRSDITDFEEVVRLDTEYIEHWTIGLDIKILIKTVLAVVKHEGLHPPISFFSLDKERITSSIPFTNRRIPRIHPMARKVLIGLTRV